MTKEQTKTLAQLYQKQVEAWKERFMNFGGITRKGFGIDISDDLLSSRHKDTIELLEAEIERKRGMKDSNKFLRTRDGGLGDALGGGMNMAYHLAIDQDIAYLEEELRKLKNEQ